ncbi:MAG TPA: hypothetical protein VG935_04005 [Patescibacteria group bacterium]|nr:hypothetical protein [Patescibacteria group bacterium]
MISRIQKWLSRMSADELEDHLRDAFVQASKRYRLPEVDESRPLNEIVFSWERGYRVVDKKQIPLLRVVRVSIFRLPLTCTWDVEIHAELRSKSDVGTMELMYKQFQKSQVRIWTHDREEFFIEQLGQAISWVERAVPNGKTRAP